MLIRLIILTLLFYLVAKIFAALFSSKVEQKESAVRGKSQNEPLDLSREDVEDVDYKDLPQDK